MISIIISTNNDEFFRKVSESIHKTIGVPYEIIKIENNHQYSLCKAYNIGESRAIYPYLCFVHDDVAFMVDKWGPRLISLFESDPKIGLVGIAGNKFRGSYPAAIGQGPSIRRKYMRGNVYQLSSGYLDFDSSVDKKEIEDVVCIDGVFMFAKNEVFQYCHFDEALLTQFHGYDLDFSLQTFFQGYRVLVDRGMLIEHFSGGNYSKENTKANRKISKKWMKKLPVATPDLNISRFRLYYSDVINSLYFLYIAIKRELKF